LSTTGDEIDPRRAVLARYDILDTAPETAFEDVVRLAAMLLEMPVSLVSLVDADRQWFKARIGFPRSETTLSESICAHAIQGDDLFVIRDTTQDARTADNPLVTGEPHVRFYAGMPLRTPEGEALGTLCVLDTRPRDLTPVQAFTLRTLARQVMTELDLRRALKERQESDRRNAAIIESAIDYGIIAMDLAGLITSWNVGAERVLGWTEAEILGRSADLFFIEADRASDILEREMSTARAMGRANDERWHQRKDGTHFWAQGEMMPLRDGSEAHIGYLKILRDRTVQHRAEEALEKQTALLQTVTDHLSESVFRLTRDDIITFANPAAEAMLGWGEGELIGQNLHDVAHHHHADGRPFPSSDCEVVRSLRTGKFLRERATTFFRRDGTPIDVITTNAPIIEAGLVQGAVLTVADVTERKAASARLRRSEERLGLALGASGMIGTWDWDLRENVVYADANFARIYTVDPERAALGAPLADYTRNFHPDDVAMFQAELDRLFAGAEEFACEYRIVQPDGSHRWVIARGRLVRAPDGTPLRFPGASVDITERKRSEERQAALVELGERLGALHDPTEMAYAAAEIAGRTLGLTRAAYGTLDATGCHLDIARDWTLPGVTSIAGRHRYADYGSYLPELRQGRAVIVDDVEADPRTAPQARGFRALDVRTVINLPLLERGHLVAVLCLHDAKRRNWTPDILDFVRNVVDRTRAAVARLRAEEQQELLNRELSHRMKNLLAMVQSIATQTMRSAVDVDTAKEVLAGRLIALGQAHDLLMGGALGSTLIGPVVRGALKLHEDRSGRFHLDGPDLEIGAKPALSLALMLHELATNAAKYGALSREDGHVAIRWSVRPDADEAHLVFSWAEVGGPPVIKPARKGFGSRFIERGLAGQVGGTIALAFPPDGVTCTIAAPLAAFQSDT
jgi:PAS domain S-box-containing protein